ncbi:MAG: hypothetical protein IAE66_00460 [Xanthomonadaceae bacterium]|nr:hypothetical protein [Xanthomonadaceae bacterium]
MIARMLLVLLLVMNLGVAAWWALHRPAPPPAAAPPDTAVPTLELMRASDAASTANVAAVAAGPASPVEATSTPNPATTIATPAAMVCARFGPYPDEASVQAARGQLAMPGVQASVRSAGGANVRGYNVVMPPLPDREAALAMAGRLRAAGFNDLIVLGDGASTNGIALGRFGAEENARRHQTELQAKGFATQVQPIGDAAVSYWLDVRAPAGFDANAQRARVGATRVQARDCPA